MPRNQTLSELWPSDKDPSFRWSMGRQRLEEEVERRERYNLRVGKLINYKEKEESDDCGSIEDAREDNATKDEDTTADEKKKNQPDVICPVCWSSLVEREVEVLALGCGHLLCGECGEGVVGGGRRGPVCRNREAVGSIRRIFF